VSRSRAGGSGAVSVHDSGSDLLESISMKKLMALFIVASGCVMALGINCIPNVGNLIDLGGLLGGGN
jgi:hypothetical protein